MSSGIHIFSGNIPGYGLSSEGRCLPCSGVSGRAALLSYSSHGDFKPVPRMKIMLATDPANVSRRTSLTCMATSGGHRRNPDFSRHNKQGHGFSRGKNKQNHERENLDNLEEPELLSSKNGPLLPFSGSPRFQATATPGPREKEIVELFRKVQAQLRERAAIKEEKKIEASQGQGERGTVDSLLKLLRKHSGDQEKGSGTDDFNLDQPDRNNLSDDEQNSSFFGSNSIARDETHAPKASSFGRPASNFRRISPVPRVKYQPEPVYSIEESTNSSSSSKSQGKIKTSRMIEPEVDPEPFPSDVADKVDEPSEAPDISESDDEGTEEPSPLVPTDLSLLKLSELRVLAKSQGLKGYSKLKKAELVELLTEVAS